MSLRSDWLWDRKIRPQKARVILSDPKNQHFISLASLLLSRNNSPKEVFKDYLKPEIFLGKWQAIKRQMRKDYWNSPRIEFWQAVYEKVKEKFEKRNIFVKKEALVTRPGDELCRVVGNKLKSIRKQKGLTQSEFAKRLKISQQMISRIEKGRENISLLTLKNITASLGVQVHLDIS